MGLITFNGFPFSSSRPQLSIYLLNNNGRVFPDITNILATLRDSGPRELFKLDPTTFLLDFFFLFFLRFLAPRNCRLNNNKRRELFFRHLDNIAPCESKIRRLFQTVFSRSTQLGKLASMTPRPNPVRFQLPGNPIQAQLT